MKDLSRTFHRVHHGNQRAALRVNLGFMIAAIFLSLLSGMAQASSTSSQPPLTWIVLGTGAGPVPDPERSHPSNVLVVNNKPWIIDCGDGAMHRLAASGFQPPQVENVFISHLHMDHYGGLQALIGLRWFGGAQSVLTVYGPPGIDEVVSGIKASMGPSVNIGRGVFEGGPTFDEMFRVVIVKDDTDFTSEGVRVRAIWNNHLEAEHAGHEDIKSISYRFDYDNYSIAYTGDTGPDDKVASLAKGVDVLVSEVFAVEPMIELLQRKKGVVFSESEKSKVAEQFEEGHLTPQNAGKIAAKAGAKSLVFTHLGIPGPTNIWASTVVHGARETYKGQITVARDLDRF